MLEFLKSISFDFGSFIMGTLVIPVSLVLGRKIYTTLKDWSVYTLDGILFWSARIFKLNLAARLSLTRYCRMQLEGFTRYLQVPATTDISLEIDKVFVPLALEAVVSRQNIDHTNALEIGNRIRIIGDPGSGKTSITKRVFRDFCYQAMSKPRISKLPIIVELRHLVLPSQQSDHNLGEWLLTNVRDQVTKYVVYRMDECFDIYLNTSGLLVLLDGLDEVSSKDYLKVQLAINQFSQILSEKSEKNSIILTMRVQFHQQVQSSYAQQFPNVLSVSRFSPTDIYDFLLKWPFKNMQQENVLRIYQDLTDRPTLREMCSNPLILAMYVAEDQMSGSTLTPESRTEFYQKVTMELVYKRRSHQTGQGKAPARIREERLSILGRISLEHILDNSQPANLLDWNEIISATRKVTKCDAVNAPLIFRELSRDTGLVTEERTSESIRFIHLTFCEFLAAYEAIDGQYDGWKRLLLEHERLGQLPDPSAKTRLAEVLPFAAGLSPRHMRMDVISDLAKFDDERLLALGFLETKCYTHPLWQEYVAQTQKKLIDQLQYGSDKPDNSWLRRLHVFLVVVTDASRSISGFQEDKTEYFDHQLEDFFQRASSINKGLLVNLISSYARQDAAAAFRVAVLCNINLPEKLPEVIISNCDQPPFLALVYQKAASEDGCMLLWSAILAEAALRSPAVASALLSLKSIETWSDAVDKLETKNLWFTRKLVTRSFLTECLSLSINNIHIDHKQFPLLFSLKSVTPPSGMPFISFVHRYQDAVFLVSYFLFSLFYYAVSYYTYTRTPNLESKTLYEAMWILFKWNPLEPGSLFSVGGMAASFALTWPFIPFLVIILWTMIRPTMVSRIYNKVILRRPSAFSSSISRLLSYRINVSVAPKTRTAKIFADLFIGRKLRLQTTKYCELRKSIEN